MSSSRPTGQPSCHVRASAAVAGRDSHMKEGDGLGGGLGEDDADGLSDGVGSRAVDPQAVNPAATQTVTMATVTENARPTSAVPALLTSVEVVAQDLRTRGVPEFGHRLRLDLSDPLAGYPEDPPDLIEGLGLAVGQPEAHADHAGLPLAQGIHNLAQLLLKEGEANGVRRNNRLGILDEVAEFAVAVLAEGGMEGDRLAAILLDLDHLLRCHVELGRQLVRCWLAAQVLEHLPLNASELVDDLDHVDGDADGASLVRHGAGDRLPDPPRRVGRELVALGVVELLDGADEAEISLLDEVEEEHASTRVTLGERDDESEVRLEKVVLRVTTVVGDPFEFASVLGVDLLGGRRASLPRKGQPRFAWRGQPPARR